MNYKKVINDKDTWSKQIEKFSVKDVYFSYEYFVPFKNNGDGVPELFYFECDYGRVAYPYMLRDVALSKNFKGILEEGKIYDISSAYGYGGPLYDCNGGHENLEKLKKQFIQYFSNYCNEKNIVSQFDRFHPLINNHVLFEEHCELINIRKTVYINLDSLECVWENLNSKCRSKVRKSIKNEVSVVLEDNKNTIGDFKRLYNTTMDKNCASNYYYFYDNFFKDVYNSLGENVFIANAYYEDKIIASSLILRYNRYLHYHFSGSLKEFLNLSANNLLIYKVAEWGVKNGYDKFHLGGGYESNNDSLYLFKKSFSKFEDCDFLIGKKIYDYNQYRYLTMKLNAHDIKEISFFPAYRQEFI